MFCFLVPVIVCPSLPQNESGSISFDRPMLENFPYPERVFITYSIRGRLLVTLPATTPTHELHDFDFGLKTLITVVASDSDRFASCVFHYHRLPGNFCLSQ